MPDRMPDSIKEKRVRTPALISVLLQPEGRSFEMERPKTVLQLMRKLGIRRQTALVIRDGGLLTEDQAVYPKDSITIRVVTSSG